MSHTNYGSYHFHANDTFYPESSPSTHDQQLTEWNTLQAHPTPCGDSDLRPGPAGSFASLQHINLPPPRTTSQAPAEQIPNHPHHLPPRPRNELPSLPIARFAQDDGGPWTPERSLGKLQAGRPVYHPYVTSLHVPPFSASAPGSERGSDHLIPSAAVSDSGYSTQRTTHSIKSLEPSEYMHEYPDFSMHGNLRDPPYTSGQHFTQDGQSSHHSQRLGSRRKAVVDKCPYCTMVPKCASDLKKHKLKHEKPFRCEIQGCTRQPGFTTKNDLDRHKKSVHKIDSATKSYKCAFVNCRRGDKIWPRLDNFKQHVQRMHPDVEVMELIKQSEYRGKLKESASMRSTPAAFLETTLAGMDDKSKYKSIHPIDNSSDHSLMLEADTSDWTAEYNTSEPNNDAQNLPTTCDPDISLNYLLIPGNCPCTDERKMTKLFHTSSSSRQISPTIGPISPMHSETSVTGNCASETETTGQTSTRIDNPQLLQQPNLAFSECSKGLDNLPTLVSPETSHFQRGESINNVLVHIPNSTIRAESNVIESSSPAKTKKRFWVDDQGSFPETRYTRLDSNGPRKKKVREDKYRGKGCNLNRYRDQPKSNPIKSSGCENGDIGQGKRCSSCNKVLARNCDMKKHMKRHTRPYGCTFPGCFKKFGSKNDWKRHENSQHSQTCIWTCDFMEDSLGKRYCGQIFLQKELFETHIKAFHHSKDPSCLNTALTAAENKRKSPSGFWCGFCEEVVQSKELFAGNLSCNDRFNHIDEHFKQGANTREWFCQLARKTKGDAKNEIQETSTDHTSLSAKCAANSKLANDPAHSEMLSNRNTCGASGLGDLDRNDRTRNHCKQIKKELMRFCCNCENGPWASKLYSSCTMCNHEFCLKCSNKTIKSTSITFSNIRSLSPQYQS